MQYSSRSFLKWFRLTSFEPCKLSLGCLQEHSRPCSQCSLCSSTFSSSPKLEKTYSFKGHLHSPPTHTDKGRSPCIARRPPNGITAPSTAHHLLDAGVQGSGCEVDNTGNRKNSLPEIISEPDSKAFRVRWEKIKYCLSN